MKTLKRTKVETEDKTERTALGAPRYVSIIKEIYVDSGKVKRILVKLDALDRESLQAQWTGAMAAILENRNVTRRRKKPLEPTMRR